MNINTLFKMTRISISGLIMGTISALMTFLPVSNVFAQCPPAGDFGIDRNIYSIAGQFDWFEGSGGNGVISEDPSLVSSLTTLLQTSANPLYEAPQKVGIASKFGGKILIDAIYAKDQFGGTGHIDQTSYVQASKNGENPAIWKPGPANVLGKNDIIDIAGFMFRDGETIDDNLYFVGIFNMAEPGGTSYMDFEFFVEDVQYSPSTGFQSGGPQLGHTAYNFIPDPANPGQHVISKIGDFIFSVSLLSSGPVVETRLWVSRTDWQNTNPTNFSWAGTFDGAFNNAPFGYAGIVPKTGAPQEFCGVTNTTPTQAPPWGTRNTKTNQYGTTYQVNSLSEVSINLTAFGMDHASLLGDDECVFPLNTFLIKTRASASFTAQLKDFAGPYSWGTPTFGSGVITSPISCTSPTAELFALPGQEGIEYTWTTVDGNIVDFAIDGEPWRVLVDKPGTYEVFIEYETECFPSKTIALLVESDPLDPFFNEPILLDVIPSCDGDDGLISLNVTGANGPYTYTWERDGSPYTIETGIAPGNHTLADLPPGTYSVTVQGPGQCTAFLGGVEIIARTPLVYTETEVDATCFGFNDGRIELGTVTGNGPLSYLWSTGNTSKDLLNIGAGTYTVTITDADGCETEDTFTIGQPAAIIADITAVDDTDPDPLVGNGTITLSNISGGTVPYSFQWSKDRDAVTTSNFSTSQNLINLRRGLYTVTITDDNGCTFVTSANIWEPEICDDGIDNSGNGLTDCDDPACTPDPPGLITANDDTPCVDPDGLAAMSPYAFTYFYEVPVNPDYDSYEWTVPMNAVIVAGQGTNEIEVAWLTTAGGQICVRGRVFDCLSVPSCISVNVINVPPSVNNIQID